MGYYKVNIDGGKMYVDGRLASFILDAVESFEGRYADDEMYRERAIAKLRRSYDNIKKELEGVSFEDGWGELVNESQEVDVP